MGSLSIWHWMIVILVLVFGIPIAISLTRSPKKIPVHSAQRKLKQQP